MNCCQSLRCNFCSIHFLNIDFSLLLLLFKGRIRDFCKSSEIRFLGGLVLITVPVLSGFLVAGGKTVKEGLRLSIFNAFSALSTTGLSQGNRKRIA